MSQAFRAPPRQMGFKPRVRRLVPGAPATEPSVSEHAYTTQLQQLYTRKENLSLQLTQVHSTLLKNRLQAQIQPLELEIENIEQSLSALRLQTRLKLLSHLPEPCPDLLLLVPQFASLEAIYKQRAPLLKQQRPLLQTWLRSVESILLACQQNQVQPAALALAEAQFQRLLLELSESEQVLLSGIWQKYIVCWQAFQIVAVLAPIQAEYRPNLSDVSEVSESNDDFEPISFELESEVEVSFDFAARRSVVRNQMGITLNQVKNSYQEYLDMGFTAIDQSLASRFQNREALSQAVSYFLEAMSLDKARYEAYFGLGYLYSLVQDLDHALYFLKLAYKISNDPSIAQMMTALKQTAGLCGPAE